MEKFKVISLFSGGMGLDLGLESTGLFDVVACVEKIPAFCNTIRHNQKNGLLPSRLQVFEGDISNISPTEVLDSVGLKVGEVDLVIGGPPCQSFSTAGRRGTVQDPRGTLLWEYLRFIEAIKPKMFLMENVRGLLSAALNHRPIAERPDKGGCPLTDNEKPGSVVRLFARDLSQLKDCSYHLDIFEVNAVNYGAPQLRERVLFLGNRFNATLEFPAPTHGAKRQSEETTLPGLLQQYNLTPWKTMGDAISNLCDPHPVVMDFSPRKKRFLELIPEGSNWRSLPEDMQKESMGKAWFAKGGRSGWWRRLSFDLPCPTLVTMPNHASTALCHPIETRALSIREYAKIQEFPDEWEFCGTPLEQYAQVGNAVPLKLGYVAGRVIGDTLKEFHKRDWEPYPIVCPEHRIIYLQSHVRTRQWFKNGETIVRNGDGDNGHSAYRAPKTIKKTSLLEMR
jgi:DNA (cytosine-5)-methyltransferase 1